MNKSNALILLALACVTAVAGEKRNVSKEVQSETIVTESYTNALQFCHDMGRPYMIRVGTQAWYCLPSKAGVPEGVSLVDVESERLKVRL